MIVSIFGKRWRLEFSRLTGFRGDCTDPNGKKKRIRVDDRLTGEERLEVIIHEIRHAADWSRDESFVERESRDTARILWRLGYRNIHEEKES